jgi:hypothetical protein
VKFFLLFLCVLSDTCLGSLLSDVCGSLKCDNGIVTANLIGTDLGSNRYLISGPLTTKVTAATLYFDVYFPEDFKWVLGGKLLGLGPTYTVAGGAEGRDDGWSVRLMFKAEGKLAIYSYIQDRSGVWGDGPQTASGVLNRGVWNSIKLKLKLNSENQLGYVYVYVDNSLVLKMENVKFRSKFSEGSLISKFLFHVFYGGHTKPWAPVDENGKYESEKILFRNMHVDGDLLN